jgi:hypothetical protein
MHVALPSADAVAAMLENLLGREVYVSDGDSGESLWSGRYITRDDQLAAVGLADIRMVAYAGSALSMVPPATAQDVVKEGDPTSAMIENLHEVLNVAASLMMDAGSDHVRLDGIEPVASLDAVAADLVASGTGTSFVVDIDGYGKGGLSFVTHA